MANLDPESFTDIYFGVALESVRVNVLPTLDDFYEDIYGKVSKRTGIPREGIKYLHHAFHWVLFLRDYSPLETTSPREVNGLTRVRLKSNPLEKSELVSRLLGEHGIWLEERMKKLSKSD